jgi:hypothetical protein
MIFRCRVGQVADVWAVGIHGVSLDCCLLPNRRGLGAGALVTERERERGMYPCIVEQTVKRFL